MKYTYLNAVLGTAILVGSLIPLINNGLWIPLFGAVASSFFLGVNLMNAVIGDQEVDEAEKEEDRFAFAAVNKL
jgi:hypothetical protein